MLLPRQSVFTSSTLKVQQGSYVCGLRETSVTLLRTQKCYIPDPGGQTGQSGIFCSNTSARIPSDVILCPHTVHEAVANEPLTKTIS